MTFKALTLTPASIAFMASITVHAAIVVSVNLHTQPETFANHIHSLQISLLPAASTPITQAAKPKYDTVKQKPVETIPDKSLSDTVLTETQKDTEIIPDTSTNLEQPEPPLQPPKFAADYLSNPAPVYPLAARRRNIEGHVLLRAEIQPDGSCSQVEIKVPSHHELLNQAALEAVKKWRFIPASQDGRNVAAWVEIPINFKLENQRS